jgi:hypothetical protein
MVQNRTDARFDRHEISDGYAATRDLQDRFVIAEVTDVSGPCIDSAVRTGPSSVVAFRSSQSVVGVSEAVPPRSATLSASATGFERGKVAASAMRIGSGWIPSGSAC